jgi:TRAP-type C4-dicarboxylate transport system permease small subunit
MDVAMNTSLEKRKHPLNALLLNPINRLSDVGAILSALIFCGMVLLILAEVILRNFLGSSTEVSGEYSGYALAAMIYLGMGFSFREDAHIRITFVRERLGAMGAFVLEIGCLVFVMILSGLSCVFIWELVHTSKARNLTAYTPAETPLYIPQAIVLVGMALLTLQILARLTALIVGGFQQYKAAHGARKN